ncbi:hypothetical protein Tco_0173573 [Tanacetum coccineum]
MFSLMKAGEGERVFCVYETGSVGPSWVSVLTSLASIPRVSSSIGFDSTMPSLIFFFRMKLITPNLICPSTYQLLRSSGGDSGPDMSFDKSASPECLLSLARVSLAGVSKLYFSSRRFEGDYTSSAMFILASFTNVQGSGYSKSWNAL